MSNNVTNMIEELREGSFTIGQLRRIETEARSIAKKQRKAISETRLIATDPGLAAKLAFGSTVVFTCKKGGSVELSTGKVVGFVAGGFIVKRGKGELVRKNDQLVSIVG